MSFRTYRDDGKGREDSLVKKFTVSTARIDIVGFGSSRPVEANDPLEGRAKNWFFDETTCEMPAST